MDERPPIQRWWATYILVGAAAVVALIAAFESVARFFAPLAHLGLVVMLGIVVAFILAPVVARLERLTHRRAAAVLDRSRYDRYGFGAPALLGFGAPERWPSG